MNETPRTHFVDDGFGNMWQCQHGLPENVCNMQIVRPGKVQCSCDTGFAATLRECAALRAQLSAAERALKECDRELDWLRRKFDQLLPGEHVWSAANEVIKWPHCSVCGIILRTDHKNSPCKGEAKIGLRDDSARKAGT